MTGNRGTVTALDPASGRVVWTVSLGRRPSAAAVVTGGVVIYSESGHGLTAVRATTGAILWRLPYGLVDQAASAAAGVFGVLSDTGLVGIRVASGTVAWTRSDAAGLTFTSLATASDGRHLFAALTSSDRGSGVVALDPTSGRSVWQSRVDLPPHALPTCVVAAGIVLEVASGGDDQNLRLDRVAGFDPATGHRLFTVNAETNAAVPVALGGRLLFPAGGGADSIDPRTGSVHTLRLPGGTAEQVGVCGDLLCGQRFNAVSVLARDGTLVDQIAVPGESARARLWTAPGGAVFLLGPTTVYRYL